MNKDKKNMRKKQEECKRKRIQELLETPNPKTSEAELEERQAGTKRRRKQQQIKETHTRTRVAEAK